MISFLSNYYSKLEKHLHRMDLKQKKLNFVDIIFAIKGKKCFIYKANNTSKTFGSHDIVYFFKLCKKVKMYFFSKLLVILPMAITEVN